jgi:hypothetical protein
MKALLVPILVCTLFFLNACCELTDSHDNCYKGVCPRNAYLLDFIGRWVITSYTVNDADSLNKLKSLNQDSMSFNVSFYCQESDPKIKRPIITLQNGSVSNRKTPYNIGKFNWLATSSKKLQFLNTSIQLSKSNKVWNVDELVAYQNISLSCFDSLSKNNYKCNLKYLSDGYRP